MKRNSGGMYKMDEKGCRLRIDHYQTALTNKVAQRMQLQSLEHAESVTIIGCVNAFDSTILPMIIFKGKRCN